MKKLKQLSLLGMLCLSFSATSQFYLGGQLNYNRYLGGTGLGFLGLGVNGEIPMEDNSLRFSFNYGLPAKEDATFAMDSISGYGYADDINGTVKYGFLNFYVDYKLYLMDGDYEDGGLYAFGGLGLAMVSVNYELDDYDETALQPAYDYSKENYFQPIIRAGAGYEVGLDFGNLFFEAFGNVPANSVSGVGVDINLPFAFGVNAGIKIPIGG